QRSGGFCGGRLDAGMRTDRLLGREWGPECDGRQQHCDRSDELASQAFLQAANVAHSGAEVGRALLTPLPPFYDAESNRGKTRDVLAWGGRAGWSACRIASRWPESRV